MDVLFVLWAGGGNVAPFVELGRRLTRRGHRVRALADEELRPRFEAEAVSFAGTTWRDAASAAMADIAARPPDVVVADFMQPDVLCVVEQSKIRWAALVHTLYARMAIQPFTPMSMGMGLDEMNALRATYRLPLLSTVHEVLDRADRVLVVTGEDFDGPAGPVAPNVRYVGALVEGPGPDAGWTPAGTDERGPLVVVSMGSTPMDETPVIQRVVDGLAHERARVVVMAPPHVDRNGLRPPSNVTVIGYVRHAAVFPHADVVVSHAGLGTVNAALSHGVPLVCLPLGRDQPVNAARVAEVGAGLQLAADVEPDAIAEAVKTVLADPSYRAAAARFAEAWRRAGSGDRAVAELEQLA